VVAVVAVLAVVAVVAGTPTSMKTTLAEVMLLLLFLDHAARCLVAVLIGLVMVIYPAATCLVVALRGGPVATTPMEVVFLMDRAAATCLVVALRGPVATRWCF
jgi:hypothetical protein